MPYLQHSSAVCGHVLGTIVCRLIAVDTVNVAAERTVQDAVNAVAKHTG